MSLGDERDYGSDAGRSEGMGGTGQTRTRLPEGGSGDVYGGGRRPVRASRSLVTVVGVVVLLIAAIAFANRGGGTPADTTDAKKPGADPTAASGVKPVTGYASGIPSGFAHDGQGAQSAASNYAVALGSDGMFKAASRHQIIDRVYTPAASSKLQGPMDSAYSVDFLKKLGLDAAGDPPKGSTFVSRTVPVGTKVESISTNAAQISVWYTGLIGMAGSGSTDPVHTAWKTWTFSLNWTDGDWKVVDDRQKDGPAPVAGDAVAAGSDEISKAVEEYGGFTYAR
ncbi:hypothetical protein [Streptomyces sp. NBC_00344]|uniref:hypothetical protein n=1 Tax=Streptomyces sp. NBC_00344 TaxID=2975720 RepID=UPI002E1D793B